ncbi:deoxynucleotidyltransferase terminal-interacting protein 1 [Cricetulus griseus]|nr:deoxynucleotidyltransferase terminal-interacting protein 1 [Cricetulus griseus]
MNSSNPSLMELWWDGLIKAEPLEHNDKTPAGAAKGPPLSDDHKVRLALGETGFTDPAISMDLLRAVLQPSINEEIQSVFNKYMKFFQKAALNVRDNVGEEVDAEQLIQEACRSCLEQAKLLFSDGEKVIPRLTHELPGIKRGRQAEEESHRGSPIPKKRKGRPPGHVLSNDRAAAGMVWKPKSCEPIRREGPKYAADPQDKHWLAEQHHMRATGGKMAYLLIEEDIRDLAASDDYRGCLDLKLEELKSFVLPPWMVEKMRKYMETLRTENEHRAAEAPPQT